MHISTYNQQIWTELNEAAYWFWRHPLPHPKTQCSGMSHSFWVSVLKNIHFSDHELKGYPSPCDAGGSQYCSLCLCIHQKAQFLKEGSEQQEPESVLARSQRVADHQGT